MTIKRHPNAVSLLDGTIYEGLSYRQVILRLNPRERSKLTALIKRDKKKASTKRAENRHYRNYKAA